MLDVCCSKRSCYCCCCRCCSSDKLRVKADWATAVLQKHRPAQPLCPHSCFVRYPASSVCICSVFCSSLLSHSTAAAGAAFPAVPASCCCLPACLRTLIRLRIIRVVRVVWPALPCATTAESGWLLLAAVDHPTVLPDRLLTIELHKTLARLGVGHSHCCLLQHQTRAVSSGSMVGRALVRTHCCMSPAALQYVFSPCDQRSALTVGTKGKEQAELAPNIAQSFSKAGQQHPPEEGPPWWLFPCQWPDKLRGRDRRCCALWSSVFGC